MLEIFRNSIYITGLVIVMMLVIEYINVSTRGRKFTRLGQSPLKQVFLGASLGLIPGCMGGFAAVSLFSHNIFGFGGLLAALISDTGDETFVMFALMPEYAVLIKILTFTLAVGAGLAVNALIRKRKPPRRHFDHNLEIHHECDSSSNETLSMKNIRRNLCRLSLRRIAILSGILLFMIALGAGLLEHDHNHDLAPHSIEQTDHHEHDENCIHDHNHAAHGNIFSERWINLLFLFVALAAFLMLLSVSEHFLKEHIVGHIIRRHIFRVFIWTFGSLLFIYLLDQFVHYDRWMHNNQIIMLLIAVIIGVIPQSGPHIVFISMYLQGAIPFSILLANSIVQNGHSCLPLLAETKKGFVNIKSIGIALGLIVGMAGYLMGW
jgi:hypothetical protein